MRQQRVRAQRQSGGYSPFIERLARILKAQRQAVARAAWNGFLWRLGAASAASTHASLRRWRRRRAVARWWRAAWEFWKSVSWRVSLHEFRGSYRIGTDSQCKLMRIFPVVEVTLDSCGLRGLQPLFSFRQSVLVLFCFSTIF